MKKSIITLAVILITVSTSFATTHHGTRGEGTRNVSRTIPASVNDGQNELIANDSINLNSHMDAHKFVRPVTDYQIVIVANTMQVKVYDGFRYVGSCNIDQIRNLIIMDGVTDNIVHPVNAVVNNK